MLDRVLSILAPHSCCGCGNTGSLLCDQCKNNIVYEPFSACLVCLGPVSLDNLCYSCRGRGIMDGAWCVSARAAELKALLDRYKFDSAIEAGALCADFLDKCVPILPEATTVVPVPTSPARIRARGFDHTAVIAWQFAKIRNFPYHAALLRTGGQTQHFKSRTERFRTAAETVAAKSVVPEVVLLIDDIYTTGATIQACADKLRQQGAKQLYVAIIARQTLDDNSDL